MIYRKKLFISLNCSFDGMMKTENEGIAGVTNFESGGKLTRGLNIEPWINFQRWKLRPWVVEYIPG